MRGPADSKLRVSTASPGAGGAAPPRAEVALNRAGGVEELRDGPVHEARGVST